jgi:hypothetical protein
VAQKIGKPQKRKEKGPQGAQFEVVLLWLGGDGVGQSRKLLFLSN